MTRLTQEQKTKWLEALRSGKFKQGEGSLRLETLDGPRYCCLGVLKEVCGLSSVSTHYLKADEETYVYLDSDVQGLLGAMNDGTTSHKKRNFSEIADYIEQHVEAQ